MGLPKVDTKGGTPSLDPITVSTVQALYANTLISLREMAALLDISVNTIRAYTEGIERKAKAFEGIGRAVELMMSDFIPPKVACMIANVNLGDVLLVLQKVNENVNDAIIAESERARNEGTELKI